MIQDDRITPVILVAKKEIEFGWFKASKKHYISFLKFFRNQSLFQNAVLRAIHLGQPVIVCHRAALAQVQKQLHEIGIVPHAIILEPEQRGTAAAVAAAAFHTKNSGKTLLIMPSDQIFESGALFYKNILNALSSMGKNIVLFGTKPMRSKGKYGYIKTPQSNDNCYEIDHFIENDGDKDLENSIEHKKYLWNTGMYLLRPEGYLSVLKARQPKMYKLIERAYYVGEASAHLYNLSPTTFKEITPMSFGNAVLNNDTKAIVCELDIVWHDIRNWHDIIGYKIKSIFQKQNLIDTKKEDAKKAS